jgi:hypothetical protein
VRRTPIIIGRAQLKCPRRQGWAEKGNNLIQNRQKDPENSPEHHSAATKNLAYCKFPMLKFLKELICDEPQKGEENIMLEPDTTTSEVLWMYLGWFVFVFALVYFMMKKNS